MWSLAAMAQTCPTFGLTATDPEWIMPHLGPLEEPIQEVAPMKVRLPPDVRAWIAAQAERDAGSMNSVIVRSIRRQMEAERDVRGA